MLGPAPGQTFEFSPTGESNHTIQLFNGPITSLTILATGVNGIQPGETFTVGYSDGSTSVCHPAAGDGLDWEGYALDVVGR